MKYLISAQPESADEGVHGRKESAEFGNSRVWNRSLVYFVHWKPMFAMRMRGIRSTCVPQQGFVRGRDIESCICHTAEKLEHPLFEEEECAPCKCQQQCQRDARHLELELTIMFG